MKNKSLVRNDFVKLIAVIAMVVDHLGAVFFPGLLLLRVIGRLAFPIFAFGVAEGYHYTSNIGKYMVKMALLGIFSQLPYMFLFLINGLNIAFTFLVGLGLIWAVDKRKYWYVAPILALPFLFKMDYGIFGVLLVFSFHFFRENKIRASLVSIGLLSIFAVREVLAPFHLFGVLLAQYWPERLARINLGKGFFYWFYFAHLVILLAVRQIMLNL